MSGYWYPPGANPPYPGQISAPNNGLGSVSGSGTAPTTIAPPARADGNAARAAGAQPGNRGGIFRAILAGPARTPAYGDGGGPVFPSGPDAEPNRVSLYPWRNGRLPTTAPPASSYGFAPQGGPGSTWGVTLSSSPNSAPGGDYGPGGW